MIRALLTLVLLFPLVIPPGMCDCGRDELRAGKSVPAVANKTYACNCHRHAHLAVQSMRSVPTNHKHDCLAVCTSALDKGDTSARVTVDRLCDAAPLIIAFFEKSGAGSPFPIPTVGASPPIYLVHQTFLI